MKLHDIYVCVNYIMINFKNIYATYELDPTV